MNTDALNREHEARRQMFIDGQYKERYGFRLERSNTWVGPRPARLAATPSLSPTAWEKTNNMEPVGVDD